MSGDHVGADQGSVTMGASVLARQRFWSDGQHRQAVRAGRKHLTRFEACFQIDWLLCVRSSVGRKQMHANAADRAHGCPEHQESKEEVEQVTAQAAPQVEQNEGHEKEERE